LVITAYPSVGSFLPQSLQSNIAAVTGASGPPTGSNTSLTSPSVPVKSMAVVARDVNVRAGPSPTAKILSTLPRGLRVATLERRGDWMSVQIERAGPNAKSLQGWVYGSFLLDQAGDDETARAQSK
jgi:SH3 domain-containing protein